LFSDITVSQSYDDNILAQSTDQEGDFVTGFNPTAQLVKSVGRHNFGLALAANAQQYWQNKDENTLDIRGYVGVKTFGRSDTWRKLKVN
jgi:uncharacterized protein (PEP-CTERM system associated)